MGFSLHATPFFLPESGIPPRFCAVYSCIWNTLPGLTLSRRHGLVFGRGMVSQSHDRRHADQTLQETGNICILITAGTQNLSPVQMYTYFVSNETYLYVFLDQQNMPFFLAI